MSRMIKVMLKVIPTGTEKKIDNDAGEMQYGLKASVGTREGISVLREIFDRHQGMKKNVYIPTCYLRIPPIDVDVVAESN